MDFGSLIEVARAIRKAFDLWLHRDRPEAQVELKEAGVHLKGAYPDDPTDDYSKFTRRAHADEV